MARGQTHYDRDPNDGPRPTKPANSRHFDAVHFG